MSTGTLADSPRVRNILDNCRRQIIMHALLSGAALLLIVVIGGVLLATSLDFLIGLPSGVRALLLMGFVLAFVFVAWKYVVAQLIGNIPQKELGAAVDLSSPELKESLSTWISLQDPDVSAGEAGSEVMRGHLEEQVVGHLNRLRSKQFVNTRRTTTRCGIAAGIIILALLPPMIWPSGSQLLLARLFSPFANLESATNLYFEVENGDRTVAKGSDVQIAVVPKWRTDSVGERPESVELQLIADDGRSDTLAMTFDETSGKYDAEILKIAKPVQFRVRGGGATTKLFTISVVEAPEILAAVMTTTPPVYTGQAIERFDGMVGEMKVFERSQLEILLEFNKPVQSATFVWTRRDQRPQSETEKFDQKFDHVTGEAIELDPEDLDPDAPLNQPVDILVERVEGMLTADRTSATFNMVADVGGEFVFEVADEFQLLNPPEPDRDIDVVFDSPPELTVTGLHDDDRFRPDDIIPVNCHVVDDIGIGDLELHYRINEDVMKILSAAGLDRGATVVQHSFRLQLKDLQPTTGSFISIRVRAADERPEPGAQEVWSQEFNLRIDDNAEAAGARALEQETKQLVDNLKQLEQELKKDAEKAGELKEQTKKEWTEQARSETQRLSEKEQQQGRILKSIANEVATHPLMKESAERLSEISEALRDQIPGQLEEAVDQDRQQANQSLETAEQQLDAARQGVHDEIERIEDRAQLEKDLAELNRLALEAEQLAKDARQQDEDRRNPENRPEEMTEQEWKQQLDQRQQQLSRQQQDLKQDLGDLIQKEQELLKSAQQSQREQLEELADRARQLADQQERLADGVREEAQEAGRDARQIADRLEQAKKDAEELNRELEKNQAKVERPELNKLDRAAEELRKGNLAEPKQNVQDVASEFKDAEKQLRTQTEKPADNNATEAPPTKENNATQPEAGETLVAGENPEAPNAESKSSESDPAAAPSGDDKNDSAAEEGANANADPPGAEATDTPQGQRQGENPAGQSSQPESPDQAEKRQQSADQSAALAERLSEIGEQIEKLRQDRNANSEKADQGAHPKTPNAESASQPQADSPPQNGEPKAEKQIEGLLDRVKELADTANQLAENVKADPNATKPASEQADAAADKAKQGSNSADAGKFSESAAKLRQAAQSAKQSASELDKPEQTDQQDQLQGLGDDLNRLADNLDGLQQDNASQAVAQQNSQQQIAQQADQLPKDLADLAERLAIPELQMPQPAQQAGEAQQAAGQARAASQQASSELQQGQLHQAGKSGQEAAAQLKQLAQLAQQAGQQPSDGKSSIPSEVGESVADALQDLQQAAQAMQQSSQQPSNGEAGQSAEQFAQGQQAQQPGEGDQSAQSQQQSGQSQEGQGQSGQQSEGQPGQEGKPGKDGQPGGQPSGSQQLSNAAKALAQAAKDALPQQFNPGETGEGESSAEGQDAMGNAALWNGQLPGASQGPAGSRNWGRQNGELESETADRMGVTRDSEYEALIRMYFREVAKATSGDN